MSFTKTSKLLRSHSIIGSTAEIIFHCGHCYITCVIMTQTIIKPLRDIKELSFEIDNINALFHISLNEDFDSNKKFGTSIAKTDSTLKLFNHGGKHMSATLELFNPVRDFSLRNFLVDETSLGQWTPRIDVIETDSNYQIDAELPGLSKSDVKITFENNTLVLSGEKVRDSEHKEQSYHKVERSFGKFSRSVYLGNDVEVEKIDAQFNNGLLKVVVLKKPEAQPRQINIK
jgi:HSP20 family protein